MLLPFLGLMFLAALDFGRVFYATQTLEDCAYAGAVYASGTAQAPSSVTPTQAAQNAACAAGVSLVPPVQATDVTVTADSTSATVTVTVQHDFQLLTPGLGYTGPVHLSRSITLHTAPVPGT